jgi:hypothetical protein
MTTRQLALVDPVDADARPTSWRLDEHTREIGLKGVAEGRRILREAAAREAARQQQRTSAA